MKEAKVKLIRKISCLVIMLFALYFVMNQAGAQQAMTCEQCDQNNFYCQGDAESHSTTCSNNCNGNGLCEAFCVLVEATSLAGCAQTNDECNAYCHPSNYGDCAGKCARQFNSCNQVCTAQSNLCLAQCQVGDPNCVSVDVCVSDRNICYSFCSASNFDCVANCTGGAGNPGP